MNKRPHLVDGWHDLPCGCKVEIKDSFPVQICDKGYQSLEENSILAEAAIYTDTKLQWPSGGRAKRWYQIRLVNVLFDAFKNEPDRTYWAYSKIVRSICFDCGDDVGACWIDLPTEPFRQWVCEACALEESQEIDAAEERDEE